MEMETWKKRQEGAFGGIEQVDKVEEERWVTEGKACKWKKTKYHYWGRWLIKTEEISCASRSEEWIKGKDG